MTNFAHSGVFSDDSFVGVLHRTDEWNEHKYWELEKDILDLIPLHQADTLPRDLAFAVIHVTSYIMSAIRAHYDQNDGWSIKSHSDEELFEFHERLRVLQLWFFEGCLDDLNAVSADLRNPLI